MKHILTVGLLTVAAISFVPSPARAGLLFHHCCCCEYKVCYKQYNAFSPFCPVCPPTTAGLCIPHLSRLHCFGGCNPCDTGCTDSCTTGTCTGGSCGSCADGSCGGTTTTTAPTTTGSLPAPSPLPTGPTFAAPAPTPAGPVSAMPMQMQMAGPMPASYAPAYYPNYVMPAGYGYPQQMMPAYGYPMPMMPSYGYGYNGYGYGR